MSQNLNVKLAPINQTSATFTMGKIENTPPADNPVNINNDEKTENKLTLALGALAVLGSAIGLGVLAYKKIGNLNSKISSLEAEIQSLTNKTTEQSKIKSKKIIEKINEDDFKIMYEYITDEKGIETLASKKHIRGDGAIIQEALVEKTPDGLLDATIKISDDWQIKLKNLKDDVPLIYTDVLPEDATIIEKTGDIVKEIIPTASGYKINYQNGENSIVFDILKDENGNISKISSQTSGIGTIYEINNDGSVIAKLNESDDTDSLFKRLGLILKSIIPFRKENSELVKLNTSLNPTLPAKTRQLDQNAKELLEKLFSTNEDIASLPKKTELIDFLNSITNIKGSKDLPFVYKATFDNGQKLVNKDGSTFSGVIIRDDSEYGYSNGILNRIVEDYGYTLTKCNSNYTYLNGHKIIEATKQGDHFEYTKEDGIDIQSVISDIKSDTYLNSDLVFDDDLKTLIESLRVEDYCILDDILL